MGFSNIEKLSCISSNPHNLSSNLEHVTLHLLVGTLMFIDSDEENVLQKESVSINATIQQETKLSLHHTHKIYLSKWMTAITI